MNIIDMISIAVLIALGGITACWIVPELATAYRNIRWLKERRLEAWLQEREDFEQWRQSRTDLTGRMRGER